MITSTSLTSLRTTTRVLRSTDVGTFVTTTHRRRVHPLDRLLNLALNRHLPKKNQRSRNQLINRRNIRHLAPQLQARSRSKSATMQDVVSNTISIVNRVAGIIRKRRGLPTFSHFTSRKRLRQLRMLQRSQSSIGPRPQTTLLPTQCTRYPHPSPPITQATPRETPTPISQGQSPRQTHPIPMNKRLQRQFQSKDHWHRPPNPRTNNHEVHHLQRNSQENQYQRTTAAPTIPTPNHNQYAPQDTT